MMLIINKLSNVCQPNIKKRTTFSVETIQFLCNSDGRDKTSFLPLFFMSSFLSGSYSLFFFSRIHNFF